MKKTKGVMVTAKNKQGTEEESMPAPVTQEWLTIKEAARRVKYAYGLVYAAVRSGELKSYRRTENAAYRIRVEDLEAWMTGQPDAG